MQAAKVLYIDRSIDANDRNFLEKRVKNIHFLQSGENLCDKIQAIAPDIVIVKNIVDSVDRCSFMDGIYLYIDPPEEIDRQKGVIIFAKPKDLEFFRSRGYEYLFEQVQDALELVEVLKHLRYYTLEEPFRRFFTKEELLKVVIPKIAVQGSKAFIVNTTHHMFELECYDGNVRIYDLNGTSSKIVSKEEFLEAIKDEDLKPMRCITIDEPFIM